MRSQSCLARMLDVRGYILATRAAFAGAEPGPALLLAVTFLLIALCLLPIWITFDLASTWEWTTALRSGAEPVVAEASANAEGLLGISIGSALAGLVLTSFTLLPSLFELAFPSVNHPLIGIVLTCSVIFDYITDFPRAWGTAAEWTDSPLLHWFYAASFCLFVSVTVQALLAVCLTATIYGIIAVVRGGSRGGGRPVMIDG